MHVSWRLRSLPLVMLGLSLVALAIASPAIAAEQEARRVDHTTQNIDAFKGFQGIRTDPATVSGVGYVHPTQVDVGAYGGDFVAIGTANGLGVDNCANDYDAKWTVYTDGVIGGVYRCDDEKLDAYTTGSNPSFTIQRAWCPSQSATRWLLFFGGTLWRCMSHSATGAIGAAAGLETTGSSTTDRNIDVKYTGLNTSNINSSTWNAFGAGTSIHSPNYSYQYVSTTAFNVYLAPLN